MPTLIRLIVVLLVLAGIGYGGMLALVMTVNPSEKDVTIRIPARDLIPREQQSQRREIDTSVRPTAPAEPAPAAPLDPGPPDAADPPPPAAAPVDAPDVQTLSPGIE
jgi:hypothetical protein